MTQKSGGPAREQSCVDEPRGKVWTLKPGVDAAVLADRFATIAAELDTIAVGEADDKLRSLRAAAAQVADEAFIDPNVGASIAGLSAGSPTLVKALDAVSAHITHLPEQQASVVWPLEVTGGERLLHFRLVRRFGEGGMGSVFLAWDERLDRRVVLKRLAPAQEREEGYRRLEREARTAARLRHPNIVAIYALEYIGPEPIVVQEYVEGDDLDTFVGEIAIAQGLEYARSIASAIAHAHSMGVVHRDLKPRNIRIRTDGTPVVLDFGLGKAVNVGAEDRTQRALTQAGIAMGTPHYMAPEQWAGEEATPAIDVFAFGVVLFELLTGEVPFSGGSHAAIYAAILKGDVAIPDVPQVAQDLIRACLSTDPSDRPSMEAVLAALERAEGTRQPEATMPVSPPTTETGAVLATPLPTVWIAMQRERARKSAPHDQGALELHVTFRSASMVSPERLARFAPPTEMGAFDEEQRTLGVEDVSAIGAGNGYQYLALRTNGDLFYLASVTQRPYGAVAIEPVLSTVIATLAYATRLGTALRTASDAELLIALGLQGAGSWFITSAEWSERFSATVRGLGGPCPRELHSAVQTTLGALRSKPTDTVQLLVDTLIASSRLLTIPTAVYERRVGAAEFARS